MGANEKRTEDDAAKDAPEMKALRAVRAIERRAFPFRLAEVRDGQPEEDSSPVIVGHAAVFDSPSEPMDLWYGETFLEVVARGAFAKTLQESDIRALFNHNPDYVLGRNKAGTLTLREDQSGLYMECQAPDTGYARDLAISMRRGDIDQMSFGFQVIKERWEEDNDAKTITRTLLEVRLFDVSVVTYPAYPATDAAVRSLLTSAGVDIDQLAVVVKRAKSGQPLSPCDGDALRCSLETLRAYLPEPTEEDHSDTEASRSGHSLQLRRRRLNLLEKSLL